MLKELLSKLFKPTITIFDTPQDKVDESFPDRIFLMGMYGMMECVTGDDEQFDHLFNSDIWRSHPKDVRQKFKDMARGYESGLWLMPYMTIPTEDDFMLACEEFSSIIGSEINAVGIG
jgi:hypothetical protein